MIVILMTKITTLSLINNHKNSDVNNNYITTQKKNKSKNNKNKNNRNKIDKNNYE